MPGPENDEHPSSKSQNYEGQRNSINPRSSGFGQNAINPYTGYMKDQFPHMSSQENFPMYSTSAEHFGGYWEKFPNITPSAQDYYYNQRLFPPRQNQIMCHAQVRDSMMTSSARTPTKMTQNQQELEPTVSAITQHVGKQQRMSETIQVDGGIVSALGVDSYDVQLIDDNAQKCVKQANDIQASSNAQNRPNSYNTSLDSKQADKGEVRLEPGELNEEQDKGKQYKECKKSTERKDSYIQTQRERGEYRRKSNSRPHYERHHRSPCSSGPSWLGQKHGRLVVPTETEFRQLAQYVTEMEHCAQNAHKIIKAINKRSH
ncbi:hypothetical protein DdX_13327 [Ditylenchus destructor]|uniref:Uncharacterized protein n=1 Tax=Ditylenchus destructor TaxID=166010 RepID=A0AAD4MWQ0_9BILA|nr:hypothetical protein DdX_13327 [Ditylenchus destructor]